ncbi:sigma 54-interacting transcriptional regulator, partial [bacterium]|nr:sigma 54-interacting transcriptional regulator [bacterium]
SEKTQARIITATNRNLEKLVEDNVFREDLYYRINVINIELPPLRDRLEDIPLLVDHFIDHFNTIQGRNIPGIADDVLTILMNYSFPGNIRELRNIIERAFVICRSGAIHIHHLPEKLVGSFKVVLPESGMKLSEMERVIIGNALERNGGSISRTAKELGIHRATLYRKLKSYEELLTDS